MKHATCLLALTLSVYAQPRPTPVTSQMLAKPDPADWLMWRRTLDSWGYSPLNQINRGNVANLKLVWTRGMAEGTQEGTPLVHDGVMFLPNPGDLIQALDAATGDLLWESKRQFPEGFRGGNANTTRTLAIFGKSVIDLSADDFVYGLDVDTGKMTWETRVLDYREDSGTQSGGPIVAGGKIFSTRACRYNNASPNGCVITAHDAATGKELWRTDKVTELSSGGSIHLTTNGENTFLYTDRGELIVASLSGHEYKEISRAALLEPTYPLDGRKFAWVPPAYANRCVFARNDKELVCAFLAE